MSIMEKIKEMVATLVNQSPNDFVVCGNEDQFGIYIKTRDGGALHFMNARPSGGGFDIEITEPRAFYFGADGHLYLSSWSEDYRTDLKKGH